MVDESIATGIDFNQIFNVVSLISKMTTEKITEFLISQGFSLTVRWVSTLLVFISALIIFLGMKVTKTIFKIILVALGIILIIGLLVPSW